MATEPRRGRWLPLIYYYLATLVGLVITLVGLIGGLQALVQAAFPELSGEVIYSESPRVSPEGKPLKVSRAEERDARDEAIRRSRLQGFAEALRGGIAAAVGAPVFLWHLRQARRKEPEWLGASPADSDRGTATQ